jgi:hypothetical protein
MGMDADRYVFRSLWRLDAHPDRVYSALADVPAYPDWWPQVRSARQLDELSGELRCRSMLPYDLVFVARRDIEDPVARVLRAALVGDLAGTSQWTISPADDGSLAVFDEDVTVRKPLIRAAGLLARPALRYNHDRMMRAGEHGLQRHLARVGA